MKSAINGIEDQKKTDCKSQPTHEELVILYI